MDEKKRNSVLVVDDEKSNIMMLTQILSPEYTVYASRSGEDAIDVAREYLPDIILLDIIMPKMDGYEVISSLKKFEETQKIPVIFVTGLSDQEEEEKGLALGASDYISKPFSPAIVKLRVRNQIRMLNYIHTIERMSGTDQLTGIDNRRSFDNRLNMEWNRALGGEVPLSMLMIDVDKFKNYNDTYGHQQGDVVLKTVANIFKHSLKRPDDFAARWGGEEFAVLLLNTPLSGALEIAEKIRENIESAVIPCADGSITKITVSIGVNTQEPSQNECTISEFVSGADEALYMAKREGRNRVVRFEG